jgi:phosphatidylglycerophosphate synthase
VHRSDRVAKVGGTALLGQEVMDWTYWSIAPIVNACVKLGITPNMLTWSALVTGVGAGVAIAFGWFGLACLLATTSTLTDIFDGQVARATNSGSNKGELLDAVVDRYTEFAFVIAFAIFSRYNLWQMLTAIAAVLACFMVSYSSAKAEAMGVKPPRGLMRRHERGFYMILGAGFVPMIAVFGNLSAVSRFVRISRELV